MRVAIGLWAAVVICSACKAKPAGPTNTAGGAPPSQAAPDPAVTTAATTTPPGPPGTPNTGSQPAPPAPAPAPNGNPAPPVNTSPAQPGNGPGEAGGAPSATSSLPPLSVSRQRAYSVRAVSEGFGPSSTKAIGASCRNAHDLLVEHKCLTDAMCGVLYESEGTAPSAPGGADVATCGARNSCEKGNITVEVVAYCLPL